MKQLFVPETVIEFPCYSLSPFLKLEKLTLPSHCQSYKNQLVVNKFNSLFTKYLPLSLKQFNGEDISENCLKKLIIPSNIEYIFNYCFANCDQLIEIKGLEYVKRIGRGCFYNCPKLKRDLYPLTGGQMKKRHLKNDK